VTARIDKRLQIGTLSCKQCGQSFQTAINALSAPIDVYSEWVDACDDVAKEQAAGATPSVPPPPRPAPTSSHPRAGLAPGEKYTAEDDGFIDDADADEGEAEYGDD